MISRAAFQKTAPVKKNDLVDVSKTLEKNEIKILNNAYLSLHRGRHTKSYEMLYLLGQLTYMQTWLCLGSSTSFSCQACAQLTKAFNYLRSIGEEWPLLLASSK